MDRLEEEISYVLLATPFIVPMLLPCISTAPLSLVFVQIVFFAVGAGAALNLFRHGARRFVAWLAFLSYLPLFVLAAVEFTAPLREQARRDFCRSQLRSLSYVLDLYAMDNGWSFPPTFGQLFCDYLGSGASELFVCTSAGKATALADDPHFPEEDYTAAMFGDTHSDYVYVSGLTSDDPPRYVLAFDDEWNHDGDGVEVLFIGDRGRWIRDLKWLHGCLAGQEKELAAKGREMKLIRPAWSSWPDPRASGHSMAGPRPWYARRRGRILAVGALGALAVSLALVVRTVRRRRKQGSSGEGRLNDEKE